MMERVALIGVIGGVLGIVVGSHVSLGLSGITAALLLSVLLGILYAWKRHISYLLVAVAVCVFALGMLRMQFVPSTLPSAFVPLLDQEVLVDGTIVADPDLRETTQRVTIEIERGGVVTRVLVVAPLYPELSYGEEVSVHGLFVRPEPFATDGGRVFAYDRFLAKEGVFAVIEDASVSLTSKRAGIDHIYGALADLKRTGIELLSKALPEPQASLAAGLILGGKQGLGESLLNDFIQSGLVHIVVLSGYNVMIVGEFVLRFFGFLPKRRAAFVAGVTIGLFVLIAGAGAASIRAGIMAAIALYARATGRTYDAFRALVLAGAVMVLLSPLSLVYDPGFQLSFLATLGLIFGAPLVEARLRFVKSDFMREIIAATVAAQIAVLPLLLYQNGLFSLVSLPANMVVLPLVPLAMLASFVAGVAGFLLPSVAPILGIPAYVLLSSIIGIVEFASRLPLAAISVPAFPFTITLIIYGVLALLLQRLLTSAASARVPAEGGLS